MTTQSDYRSGRALRVLVVDNKLVDRTDHEKDLLDWGYKPILAEGQGKALIEDAKRKAREHRCHAAIVDMRLFDDRDIGDHSGLELVPHLKPAKSVIVTGYGSVPTSRTANKHGAIMIGKEEGPDAVRTELENALQDVRRLDFSVKPDDWLQKHALPSLRSDERRSVHLDEVIDVLMMLFPHTSELHLQDLPRGTPSTPTETGLHGSSVVARITPQRLASAIVKFASPDAIRRECQNYDNYVTDRFRNRRHPQMSRRKRFWNLGAVVYTSLGEDINDIVQFQDYCHHHTLQEISAALRDFFLNVWEPLYSDHTHLSGSLFSAYDRLWSRTDQSGPLSAMLPDWQTLDKTLAFTNLQGEVLDPRRWLADHTADSFFANARQCIVHGDLHSRNFFVDKHGSTWVIDFERTGPGHILADFVELEHDFLRTLAVDLDLPTLFKVMVALVSPLPIDRKSQEDPLQFSDILHTLYASIDEHVRSKVERTVTMIHEVRKIAVELFRYESQQEYYWALLLDLLFGVQQIERHPLTMGSTNDLIYERELLMASVVSQRLKNAQSDWPPSGWTSLLLSKKDSSLSWQHTESIQPLEETIDPTVRILFLAANPAGMSRLQLDNEYRQIREALQKAGHRDRFKLENELAVRVGELIQLLVQHRPAILHFSGHGSTESEIILEDESGRGHALPHEAVTEIFEILNRSRNQIRCVVLNACFTEQQARFIAEYVDFVVGIDSEIGDQSAIAFAGAFYTCLAEKQDVQTAFELAKANIGLHRLGFQDTVRLLTKAGIDPSSSYLV